MTTLLEHYFLTLVKHLTQLTPQASAEEIQIKFGV